VGQPVVLGIRPEALYLRANEKANDPDQTIQTKLNVVEPLGSSMDLFASMSHEQRLVARVAAEPLKADDQDVTFYIDFDAVHVFAPGPHGAKLSLAKHEMSAIANA